MGTRAANLDKVFSMYQYHQKSSTILKSSFQNRQESQDKIYNGYMIKYQERICLFDYRNLTTTTVQEIKD